MRYMHGLGMAAVIVILLLSTVIAQAGEKEAAGEMAGFDANGDGKVTMSEVMRHIRPAVQKGFDALDRNHDGVLSSKDFDDVSEGMHTFEEWLNELLKPFIGSEKQNPSQTF